MIRPDPPIAQIQEENDRLRLENERLRMLAETVGDPALLGHWAECPLPPDADCTTCKQWFRAWHQIVNTTDSGVQRPRR